MYTRFLFVAFIGVLIFFSPHADAMKRAPFPSSSALQPIPVNVTPNISGNANATASGEHVSQNNNGSSVMSDQGSTTPSPMDISPQGNSFASILIGVGGLVGGVLAVGWWIQRQGQKDVVE
ncbi:MAG: hypothetical protein ACYC8S_00575 [Minisyncoccota bacterium]